MEVDDNNICTHIDNSEEFIDFALFNKTIKEIYCYFEHTIKLQRAMHKGVTELTLDECDLLCMIHYYSRGIHTEATRVVADMVYEEIIHSDKTNSAFPVEISKRYGDIQVTYNMDTGDMSDVLKKCDEICCSVEGYID